MATYVYGIVESTAKPPAASGIAGAPITVVTGDGASALVSDLPDADVRMGRDEVLMHAEVLDRALSQGTVLPMRFGVVMEGSEEVRRRLLERHADDLRSQLTELEGKVEIHIRVVYEEDVVLREVVREDGEVARLRESVRDRPEDATYYERIRLGELVAKAVERRREHDAQTIIDSLAPTALAVDVGAPAHERVVVTASFLVERGRLDEFDQVLDAVARDQAGRLRFKLTGPRPPHSFVELAGAIEVGLFTGLITVPLAPVRGVVWIAERVVEEMDRELNDEGNIRRELLQLELDHEDGKLTDEERSGQEEILLQRLAISQMPDQMTGEELGDG